MRILIIFLFPFFLFAQNSDDSIYLDKIPNDIRWVTQSKEYKMMCIQTYRTAIKSIHRECEKTQNPIIIMDIDETVLDNSGYQIELFKKNTSYNPDTWNNWVNKEISELVPGSKKFIIAYKKYSNARIIYISNRDETTLMATQNNMKKLGIYFEDDIFLLRKNKEDTKIIRRKEVLNGNNRMEDYGPKKVIAYFGDAIGDFPRNKKYKFSKNKFIFPNPMYGQW